MGCLELPGDGWTCGKSGLRWVAGLGTAGIQVHVEIPLVCSWIWELWEAVLAPWPQDELCIPRRAELLEEWESLSIPYQLENLVLSLKWSSVQGKPRVGLAEPWGQC